MTWVAFLPWIILAFLAVGGAIHLILISLAATPIPWPIIIFMFFVIWLALGGLYLIIRG